MMMIAGDDDNIVVYMYIYLYIHIYWGRRAGLELGGGGWWGWWGEVFVVETRGFLVESQKRKGQFLVCQSRVTRVRQQAFHRRPADRRLREN